MKAKQTDKAYKILAKTHSLSHKTAKALIDKGLVYMDNRRLMLARDEIPIHSALHILQTESIRVIFCDEQILAIDKPSFIESYELAGRFQDWSLLHRLDRETSGVILCVKENSAFHKAAKEAFKQRVVEKTYMALIHGILADSINIQKPIATTKKGFAKSRISKNGLYAHTFIEPLGIVGKSTLIAAHIRTGRTHQIRVHCQSIGHPICGDRIYGKPDRHKRLMLHAHKIALLGYEFISPPPKALRLD